MLAAYVAAEQKDKEVLWKVIGDIYELVFFTLEMLVLCEKWRALLLSKVYALRLREMKHTLL